MSPENTCVPVRQFHITSYIVWRCKSSFMLRAMYSNLTEWVRLFILVDFLGKKPKHTNIVRTQGRMNGRTVEPEAVRAAHDALRSNSVYDVQTTRYMSLISVRSVVNYRTRRAISGMFLL